MTRPTPATLPAGLEHQFAPAMPLPVKGDAVLVWIGGRVHSATVERPAVIRHIGRDEPGLLVALTWTRMVLPADRVTRMSRLERIGS
jgi:hypothetical protein